MNYHSNDNDFNNKNETSETNISGSDDNSTKPEGQDVNHGIGHISYTPSEDGVYRYSVKDTIPAETSTPKRFAIAFAFLLAGIFILMAGVLLGITLKSSFSESSYNNYPDNGTINIVDNRPTIETKPINFEDRKVLTVPEVASAVASSVVEIKTESAKYHQFYGSYVSEGAGSGVIITDTGFIVTNHHVIDKASSITVKLSNGSEYPASLVGSDEESDIAVLSISAREQLKPAYLGKSSTLSLGESIVVIGNPLGSLGGSVTNGIVSALDRDIIIDGEAMTLIQTNAAINPGNSGGGMFNMYGELVGIINAKSSGEDIEGIGFAIPVDHAYSIFSQLIEYGYVRGKVDHGFTLIEINDVWDMAKYNVSNTGVYIYSSEHSDDFKNGDRIITINNVTINRVSDIKTAIKNCKVGDSVSITVYRGNKKVTADLVLQEYTPAKSNFN